MAEVVGVGVDEGGDGVVEFLRLGRQYAKGSLPGR